MMQSNTKKIRIIFGGGLLIALVLVLAIYTGILGGNVRTVVPGRVFRAAQLTGSSIGADTARWSGNDLANILRMHSIHTVICLRSGTDYNAWYREEKDILQASGVRWVQIPFSDHSLPPPDRLRQLLDAFDRASYPILIHCQAGADRSGLASAIYLTVYQQIPLDQAVAGQLTWHYGHWGWGKTAAMDAFFKLYREQNGNLPLKEWIRTQYPALYRVSPMKMPEGGGAGQ